METTKVLKRKGSKELTFDYEPENVKAIQTHSRFGSNKKKFKDDLESESICIQELKYSSKVFPSVYFSQNSLRQNQALKLLMNPLEHGLNKLKNTSSLLISIMDQPNVVIVRYGNQTEILPDLDFFQDGKYEELKEFEEGYIYLGDDLSNICTPYVVVFVVRTMYSEGRCRMSRQTRFLLQQVKDRMQTIPEDSVFVIKNTRYTERDSTDELLEIAEEIEEVLQRNCKHSFKNIFHENDLELFVRLGLIMQKHMINGMVRLLQMLETINATEPQSKRSNKHALSPDQLSGNVIGIDTIPEHYALLNQCMAKLKQEIDQRNHCLELHTLRILCHRNSLVHSFGFVDGKVKVYLIRAEAKEAVTKYFQSYMKTRVLEMTFYPGPSDLRGRKLSYEQGSRIDVSHAPIIKNISYGTLGFFLMNKRRERFFTTCAHVIGPEHEAYCPDDHSVLGESVFACERFSSHSKHWIDLSLVKVCQEKILTCQQGLKGKNSSRTFSEYKIFPGSIEDLIGCNVYKWGATTNYTEGTFRNFIVSEDGFLQIGIESSTSFAMEGDSGSLICLSIEEHDSNDLYAVHIIWGGSNMAIGSTKNMFNCYHISDALTEIRENFSKEDMKMSAVTVNHFPISSSPIFACSSNFETASGISTDMSHNRNPRKRKKVLPPM